MSTTLSEQVAFCDLLHAQKYRGPRETFREAMTRIASTLADSDDHFQSFRDILLNRQFLPAGRIQSAVGSTRHVTPYNCFVSGTIEDSYTAGTGSIMARATEAATTLRLGGGIGYDFSPLRPSGAPIAKLATTATGPVSFMEIFDAVCRTTCAAGHRRGAQMGVLRVDHPDIETFIRAKQNTDRLTGFNISVGITDEFMRAVAADVDFPLCFQGKVWNVVRARVLWDMIMRSTYDWAEPGVLFIDTINQMNNLWYCEQIAATNPCGEQPLPPYGACLLGSFNLVAYLSHNVDGVTRSRPGFDMRQFSLDVRHVVRAMDNIIDRAIYPLYEQEKEAKSKRRMGLGVTGLANTIEAMGYSYGTPNFLGLMNQLLCVLRDNAYIESCNLAEEKGSFQLFDRDKYIAGDYIQTLPEYIQERIYTRGIRNSHLTSIAPTGSISLFAGNVSSGIEPVFAREVERTVHTLDGIKQLTLVDYGLLAFDTEPKPAAEVTPQEHLDVLLVASSIVDSAVSKTCNVPKDIPWNDFKRIYSDAWDGGAKGCTTYRVGGSREGILKEVKAPLPTEDFADEAPSHCFFNAEIGKNECD